MVPPRGSQTARDTDQAMRTGNQSPPENNPPLVIVSEGGRHSDASRRLVRAQAARASAAQSRETRARNREDRNQRDNPSGQAERGPSAAAPPAPALPGQQSNPLWQTGEALGSLVNWVTDVLRLSPSSFATGASPLTATGRPQAASASAAVADSSTLLHGGSMALEEVHIPGDLAYRQLPIAIPKGFVTLRHRVQLPDAFLVLVSRTACFDFASVGVGSRLDELLFDIIMTSTAAASITSASNSLSQPGPPIQGHLRIACTCLTIFQGQRADGAEFANDPKYDMGLQAAWAEATRLDTIALREPKSAEASLWAMFIISVTTRATPAFFSILLHTLLRDLQLGSWEQVRGVLLEFIYPGSFLDQPCKAFYDMLQGQFPPLAADPPRFFPPG